MEDNAIVAIGKGKMVEVSTLPDPMLVITDPVDGKDYQFIDNQAVECMQKINK